MVYRALARTTNTTVAFLSKDGFLDFEWFLSCEELPHLSLRASISAGWMAGLYISPSGFPGSIIALSYLIENPSTVPTIGSIISSLLLLRIWRLFFVPGIPNCAEFSGFPGRLFYLANCYQLLICTF